MFKVIIKHCLIGENNPKEDGGHYFKRSHDKRHEGSGKQTVSEMCGKIYTHNDINLLWYVQDSEPSGLLDENCKSVTGDLICLDLDLS